jgi:hypothetical protein
LGSTETIILSIILKRNNEAVQTKITSHSIQARNWTASNGPFGLYNIKKMLSLNLQITGPRPGLENQQIHILVIGLIDVEHNCSVLKNLFQCAYIDRNSQFGEMATPKSTRKALGRLWV